METIITKIVEITTVSPQTGKYLLYFNVETSTTPSLKTPRNTHLIQIAFTVNGRVV